MSLQVGFVERDDQEAVGESRGHDDGDVACRDWKGGVRIYDIPIAVREYVLRVEKWVESNEICLFVRPSPCCNLFLP
jgi:hypothetical protein